MASTLSVAFILLGENNFFHLRIRPLYLDDDLQLLDALREGLGWLNYTVVYLGMLVGLEIPKSQVFRTLHNVNLIGRHPLVAL